MSQATQEPAAGSAFVRLMKHYVVDYTNSHDQSQTEAIMEPDYTLRMGAHLIAGRDGDYAAATRRQLEQFPGLVLTVHEIVTNGERLAMRFSEHGASVRHDGARAAWGGIALYAWNGRRLIHNNVEQDYFSRSRQLSERLPAPVEAPAIAPWDTVAEAAVPEHEAIVRAWIEKDGISASPGVDCDDAWWRGPSPHLLTSEAVVVNDIFSCGTAVAFHVSQSGTPLEGAESAAGGTGQLHMAGLVHVAEGRVVRGRIVRDRLGFSRALRRP